MGRATLSMKKESVGSSLVRQPDGRLDSEQVVSLTVVVAISTV